MLCSFCSYHDNNYNESGRELWEVIDMFMVFMVMMFSHTYTSLQSCLTLWTVAHQAPLSMEFSRQEYWSGLPFPPPGDLPNLRIEPASPVSFTLQKTMALYSLSHLGSQVMD